jgi:hypothetical protein
MTLASRRIPLKRPVVDRLLASLVDLPVAHLNPGAFGSLFVELGRLDDEGNGQISLVFQPAWRVERTKSVWCGSASPATSRDKRLTRLHGVPVVAAELAKPIPELCLVLEGRRRIRSFCCDETQPQWGITVNDVAIARRFLPKAVDGYHTLFTVHGGRVHVQFLKVEATTIVLVSSWANER